MSRTVMAFTGGPALITARRGGAVRSYLYPGAYRAQVQLITDFRPDVIMVTPSYMPCDPRRISAAGHRSPRVLAPDRHVLRRTLEPMQCARIESGFAMDAVDIYDIRGNGSRRSQ